MTWHLNRQQIEIVNELDILGCSFSNHNVTSSHAEKRSQRCRQSFYGLSGIGMSYPGLDSETKAHLWRTICAPSLIYGCECLSMSQKDLCNLESTQSTLLKKAMGFCKRSHHTNVLRALSVPKVSDIINNNVLSLYYRVYLVDSPTRDLCIELLSLYMCNNKLIPGTLLHKVKQLCQSPVYCAFNRICVDNRSKQEDGVVDSLRFLLCHENYIKPYSSEHVLATLLTKAF